MISFKPICDIDRGELVKSITENENCDTEYLFEVLDSFESMADEDIECALSFAHGCLLVRIFDMGRYSFVYPISISDCADEALAVSAVREYAVKEEIPLNITDIPAEQVGVLVSVFRHVTLDAEDDMRSSYRAEVHSELSFIDEIEEFCKERLTFSALCDADTAKYAELCRDRSVNEFWGYDYREDVGECVADDYFINEAIAEFNRSSSLTLAVRVGDDLIGDVTFHAFDFQGHADVSFRLLSEWQGQGLGRELLLGLTEYAGTLGLISLFARVKNENKKSLSLLRSAADELYKNDKVTVFEINL